MQPPVLTPGVLAEGTHQDGVTLLRQTVQFSWASRPASWTADQLVYDSHDPSWSGCDGLHRPYVLLTTQQSYNMTYGVCQRPFVPAGDCMAMASNCTAYVCRMRSLLNQTIGVVAVTTGRSASELTAFIQAWLADRGSTQLALAQRASVPHSTLSNLFTKGVIPRPETLKRLAGAMGVPVGKLLVLAGHLTPEEYETPVQETDLARLYEVGDLTDEEWEQVKEFARYVRSRRG